MDIFCILPWIHCTIYPNGRLKTCCFSHNFITHEGRAVTVYQTALDEIWNGEYMRETRQRMLEGVPVADCAHCYEVERTTGQSHRQFCNEKWMTELGTILTSREKEEMLGGVHVEKLPLFIQLIPGNECNLRCRMCFPCFSSQIAADPIHRKWVPDESLDIETQLDWGKDVIILGPEAKQGVTRSGFHGLEVYNGKPLCWTNGNATIHFIIPHPVEAHHLEMEIWPVHPSSQRAQVRINNYVAYEGTLDDFGAKRSLILPKQTGSDPITIELLSGSFSPPGDSRHLGIAIKQLSLLCSARKMKKGTICGETLNRKYPVLPWYEDMSWISDRLFKYPERLHQLYFTGGEPFLQKPVSKILQMLIEREAASHIALELNTNGTVLKKDFLEKLTHFKSVHIGLSIDAYGSAYEYIRYPAKWNRLEHNIQELIDIANEKFTISAIVILQIYNVLDLVPLLRFLDGIPIDYDIEFLTIPWFLNIALLPEAIRKEAAAHLRSFARNICRDAKVPYVLGIADQVETMASQFSREAWQSFMFFTKELDAARDQQINPRLIRIKD
jgi:MoaA/NifB/PqqE/SkfB family radical SAM enzyme